jgi:hypothetical protein
VRWSDPAAFVFSYTGAGDSRLGRRHQPRPFRCLGTNFDPGTHPATIPEEFVAPLSD